MENDLNRAVDKQAKAKVDETRRRIRACFNQLFPLVQQPPHGHRSADEFWDTSKRLPDVSGNVIRSVLDIIAEIDEDNEGFYAMSYQSQWKSDVIGHFCKTLGFAFGCNTDDNGNLQAKLTEHCRKEVIEGMISNASRAERKTVTITGNDIEVGHE